MTGGFDKVANFFRGRPSNELLWYADFHPKWISNCPDHLRDWEALSGELGCSWPMVFGGGYKEEFDPTVKYDQYVKDEGLLKEWHTPKGSLRCRMKHNHPVEYTVKTAEDCRVLQYIYEHTLTTGDGQAEGRFHGVGVSTSPVQQLLQYEMGIETFYTLLMTDADAVERLMDSMQKKQMERTSLACKCDVPMVYQGENTSTTMISPEYYRKYSLLQIKEQVDYIHSKGKITILHMCGLLKGLLDLLKQTGIDGIHSLTPPPVGDCDFERVHELFGNEFPIQGRFGSTQWYNLDEKEIRKNLSAILPTALWREKPFILLVTMDSVNVEYEEVKRLAEIITEFGLGR